MKIVINDSKAGQSFQRELEASKASQLYGKKIGETLEGALVGLGGYTLQITGGSDSDGAPMRFDIAGTRRTHALLKGGTGVRHLKKGVRLKKRVTGNTVSERTAQLNAKISVYGPQALAELGFVPKVKEKKAAEPTAEKPKGKKGKG